LVSTYFLPCDLTAVDHHLVLNVLRYTRNPFTEALYYDGQKEAIALLEEQGIVVAGTQNIS
jgi:hypothetical protein